MKWLNDLITRLLMRRWNENLTRLLTRLQYQDLSTLEVWELFPGKSLGWVHVFVDDVKKHGYVDDELMRGSVERNYRMRRIVRITDLGRFALTRLSS